MIKAIELAKKLIKEPDSAHLEYLEDINLKKVFLEIYRLNLTIHDANLLVSFIVFAYDPDSKKIDLRKERRENKIAIAANIGLTTESELMQEVLNNENEKFNEVVGKYLYELTDWRWQTVCTLLDYHSNMMSFVNQKTEEEKTFDRMNKEGIVKTMKIDYDVDKIANVNKRKGELLEQAIQSREKADKLLSEIKKDFVNTDAATQGDFNFLFSDTAQQKVDIMSWRQYIKTSKEKKLLSRR